MLTTEAVMTTQDVAKRMNELFKENKWNEVQEEFFADDAESIEPENSMALKYAKGLPAIKKKGEVFNSMIEEMYGGWVSEPIVAGNFISFGMGMDVKMKGAERMKMDELAVYEVKDGKVVKEQFFF